MSNNLKEDHLILMFEIFSKEMWFWLLCLSLKYNSKEVYKS